MERLCSLSVREAKGHVLRGYPGLSIPTVASRCGRIVAAIKSPPYCCATGRRLHLRRQLAVPANGIRIPQSTEAGTCPGCQRLPEQSSCLPAIRDRLDEGRPVGHLYQAKPDGSITDPQSRFADSSVKWQSAATHRGLPLRQPLRKNSASDRARNVRGAARASSTASDGNDPSCQERIASSAEGM